MKNLLLLLAVLCLLTSCKKEETEEFIPATREDVYYKIEGKNESYKQVHLELWAVNEDETKGNFLCSLDTIIKGSAMLKLPNTSDNYIYVIPSMRIKVIDGTDYIRLFIGVERGYFYKRSNSCLVEEYEIEDFLMCTKEDPKPY